MNWSQGSGRGSSEGISDHRATTPGDAEAITRVLSSKIAVSILGKGFGGNPSLQTNRKANRSHAEID